MAGLLNRIKGFMRSPQGRRMADKGRELAKDPRNRGRARNLADRLRRRR